MMRFLGTEIFGVNFWRLLFAGGSGLRVGGGFTGGTSRADGAAGQAFY
jgi:hypothetical protein